MRRRRRGRFRSVIQRQNRRQNRNRSQHRNQHLFPLWKAEPQTGPAPSLEQEVAAAELAAQQAAERERVEAERQAELHART